MAPALQTLYARIGTGGEQWSGTMTQYCDGAPVGAITCEEGDTRSRTRRAGCWPGSVRRLGTSTAEEKAGPSGHELAAEAEAAATHFGNTTRRTTGTPST